MEHGTEEQGRYGLFCWYLLSVIAVLEKKVIRTHSLGAKHLVRSYKIKMNVE